PRRRTSTGGPRSRPSTAGRTSTATPRRPRIICRSGRRRRAQRPGRVATDARPLTEVPGVRRAHRLAVLTAAATCVLIVFGGLVTNTGAALAVPDWPTTFGHNMFLFPWSQMVGGVFYEHSHRLLGSLVGMLTLALAAVLWPRGGRLRALGIVAVVAVIAQGVVGGLRVVLLTDGLAMVHGPLAQGFFALIVAIALITSERMARPAPALDGATRGLTLAAATLVYLQIVFGALLTHVGRIDLHLVGALAVFALVPV